MGGETFLVDSNIFLEVLLKQERAQECLIFLAELSVQDVCVALTTFSLHSIALHLEKRGHRAQYRKFLHDCIASDFTDEAEVLKTCDAFKLDFDDAHQYWAAKKLGASLVSYDADFDRTDLKRIEPRDVFAHN